MTEESQDTTRRLLDSVLADGEGEPAVSGESPRWRSLLQSLRDQLTCGRERTWTPPARLGPFELGKKLGAGGMGTVYVARHANTGAACAIKLVPRAEVERVEALRREVEGLARVDAPNVIRVLDSGEADGFAWAATELVVGPTLAGLIASEGMPSSFEVFFDTEGETIKEREASSSERGGEAVDVRQAMGWFRDLARALADMHDAGLVHRDIKPANIVIHPSGTPYLLDLGLWSDAETPAELRGRLDGTLAYMSPEQAASGNIDIGPQSDVYSLAATFFEVLTNERYHQARGRALIENILTAPNDPRPSRRARRIPRTLDPIFQAALARPLPSRYSSARQLAEDIDRWLIGRLPRHANVSIVRRATGVLRRPRVLVPLVLLVVATVFFATRTLLEQRELALAMEEAEESLEKGESDAALTALVALADDLGDDDDYKRLLEIAVARAAGPRTLELIHSQRFTIKDPEAGQLHRRYAAEARRVLSLDIVQDADLVFHVAFSGTMLTEFAEALEFVDRHPQVVSGAPLLIQLRALLLRMNQRTEEVPATLRLLDGLTASHDADIATCFEAMRVLIGASTYENKERLDRFRGLQQRLDEIIARRPQLRLALVLRCRILMSQGRFADALRDAGRLRSSARGSAQEAGTSGMSCIAAAWAGVRDARRRDEYFARSVDDLVTCHTIDEDYLGRLAVKVRIPALHRLDWLERVVRQLGPLPMDDRCGAFLHQLAKDCYVSDARLVDRLDGAVELGLGEPWTSEHVAYRVYLAMGYMSRAGGEEPPADRMRCAERAIEICDTTLQSSEHGPNFRAIRALALGSRVVLKGDREGIEEARGALVAFRDEIPSLPEMYRSYREMIERRLEELEAF